MKFSEILTHNYIKAQSLNDLLNQFTNTFWYPNDPIYVVGRPEKYILRSKAGQYELTLDVKSDEELSSFLKERLIEAKQPIMETI